MIWGGFQIWRSVALLLLTVLTNEVRRFGERAGLRHESELTSHTDCDLDWHLLCFAVKSYWCIPVERLQDSFFMFPSITLLLMRCILHAPLGEVVEREVGSVGGSVAYVEISVSSCLYSWGELVQLLECSVKLGTLSLPSFCPSNPLFAPLWRNIDE